MKLTEEEAALYQEAMEQGMVIHQMAQQFHMAYVERVADLNINPNAGLLAMYQIARFQVLCNLRDGSISRNDVNGSRAMMEMLRELRHPDGEYPVLRMDENNNFAADGTHRQIP